MRVLDTAQTRAEYLETQIARSTSKFKFCKVSIHDAAKYRKIIGHDLERTKTRRGMGPIVCLGTRNGREVDLFRIAFFGSSVLQRFARVCERRHRGFETRAPWLEALGRSSVQAVGPRSVIGAEVNPLAARSDVWVGSFDDMPSAWSRTFGVVYSNSFDQSEDPERTAREWRRVLRPGGYLIFCYTPRREPTPTDRVGDLDLADVLRLFDAQPVHFHECGSESRYSEVIVRC